MKTRIIVLIGMVCLLALAGCGGDGGDDTPAMEATPDVDYAMRWWNVLTPDQMVAALHGDMATDDQDAAARKMYADLDDATKALVNAAAAEIYDPDADYASVGDWWETLDCRLMRVAAGDGITADPMSPYCAHYPGSGFAKILSDDAKAHVDYVGMALLYRDDPGRFIPYVGMATHGIGTTLEYVKGARGRHHRAAIGPRVHGVRDAPRPRRAGGGIRSQPIRLALFNRILGPGDRQPIGVPGRRWGDRQRMDSPLWDLRVPHDGRDAGALGIRLST